MGSLSQPLWGESLDGLPVSSCQYRGNVNSYNKLWRSVFETLRYFTECVKALLAVSLRYFNLGSYFHSSLSQKTKTKDKYNTAHKVKLLFNPFHLQSSEKGTERIQKGVCVNRITLPADHFFFTV